MVPSHEMLFPKAFRSISSFTWPWKASAIDSVRSLVSSRKWPWRPEKYCGWELPRLVKVCMMWIRPWQLSSMASSSSNIKMSSGLKRWRQILWPTYSQDVFSRPLHRGANLWKANSKNVQRPSIFAPPVSGWNTTTRLGIAGDFHLEDIRIKSAELAQCPYHLIKNCGGWVSTAWLISSDSFFSNKFLISYIIILCIDELISNSQDFCRTCYQCHLLHGLPCHPRFCERWEVQRWEWSRQTDPAIPASWIGILPEGPFSPQIIQSSTPNRFSFWKINIHEAKAKSASAL